MSDFVDGSARFRGVKRRVNCVKVASYTLTQKEMNKRKNAIRRKRRANK